ncbi:MAG: hypothetical protein KGK14_03915 [Bacteroidota bacterium]|nr:hypothetical protein [Bacteroidota bacterium]
MVKKIIIFSICIFHIQLLYAQWLLNFGTAKTVQPNDFVFISGTGSQLTFMKNPATTNFTPFLAHAGLRLGISKNIDIGYRLCTLPLPWSSVGPTLSSAFDAKFRLTNITAPYQVALIAGGGYAYLKILDANKSAWSEGLALSVTRQINRNNAITINGRVLQTIIPSAKGGKDNNYVNVLGGSIGLSTDINSVIGIMPEIGVFNMIGKIDQAVSDGIGIQVGVVLKVDFKKSSYLK